MHACYVPAKVASVMSDSLWSYWPWLARLLCPWDSPGKNTGVGCHALPPGDLPNPGTELMYLRSPALTGGFFTTNATREAQKYIRYIYSQHKKKCLWATAKWKKRHITEHIIFFCKMIPMLKRKDFYVKMLILIISGKSKSRIREIISLHISCTCFI